MRRAGKISVLTCIAVISAAGSSLSAADTVSAAGDIMRTCESGIGTDTGRIGGKNISYLDAIGFEQMELDKNGGNVCLSVTIRLDSTKIRSQHTISLTPVITASDRTHEMEFGTIIVDGNTRHKVFLRRDLKVLTLHAIPLRSLYTGKTAARRNTGSYHPFHTADGCSEAASLSGNQSQDAQTAERENQKRYWTARSFHGSFLTGRLHG